MDWQKERALLIPRTENFRDFGHNDKFTKKERDDILVKNNYTCRFCGGVYQKYLICSYYAYDKCSDVACVACHLITHLNSGRYKEMKLYYSEVPQIDIVKKTIDYIINYGEIPLSTEIDPHIKLPPISILEFISIINNNETVPIELTNYKIFYTQNLSTNFIFTNYGVKNLMFIEDDKNNKTDCNIFFENKVKTPKLITKHKPSLEEMELFNKYFS